MKIKWWGHASFLITTSAGTKILTDPYNEDLPYVKIDDQVDFVTVSHSHFDHNAVDLLPGNPHVIDNVKGYKNEKIIIKGISSYHDDVQGSDRGENIIFVLDIDQMKICHLGDLGHLLNSEQIEELTDIDILLIPVGGHYTINAEQAYKIVEQLNPAIVIPMHYQTEDLDFPISGVDKFISLFNSEKVEKVDVPEFEINQIPSVQKVYVPDFVKSN